MRQPPSIATALIALALVAGGCGSDDENPGVSGPTVPALATETAPATAPAPAATTPTAPARAPATSAPAAPAGPGSGSGGTSAPPSGTGETSGDPQEDFERYCRENPGACAD